MGAKQSKSDQPQLLSEPWRKINWEDKQRALKYVQDYKPHIEGQQLRILIHGPPGAGKSSFINSVKSVLQQRMCNLALVDNTFGDSFTQKLNHRSKLSESDKFYNKNPSFNDKVHVLVCVVPADTVDAAKPETMTMIQEIRSEARIPQVAILTKIDKVCPQIRDDLKNVYKTRYLKEKMEQFSSDVGIPMNCIFPVKNYHEEIDLDNDIDSLILSALKHIINFGEDFINFKHQSEQSDTYA